ncbi:heterokaryon incompatibility protein-domain-containing protein [Tricladium varicosporioides]|nr:heterokaryon incompatibility protein-domain-containing protein [Hymenoscyphus varicosporioides]
MEFTTALCADCNSIFDLLGTGLGGKVLNLHIERPSEVVSSVPQALSPDGPWIWWTSNGVTQIHFPHRSTQNLSSTANSCRLCKVFNSAVLRFNEESPQEPALSIQPFLHLQINPRGGVKLTHLEFHIFLDETPSLDFGTLEVIDLLPVQDATDLASHTELTSPSVDWAWLNNCMTTCLNCHAKCHQDHDENFLPTRLIHIGKTSESPIKIVDTTNASRAEKSKTQYIALSHKWGKSEFLNLRSSNIHQLSQEIRVNELPQTFKDAILASRILNVQYIWIDSLCIIQDSDTDWQTEASKMNKVYQNSLCNIAASESDGPGYGLFRQKDPSLWTPFSVKFRTDFIEDDYLCFHNQWHTVRDKSPLSKRGWVAQERLLSPRTIHFASPVFWECRELLACQVYPSGDLLHNEQDLSKLWPSLGSLIHLQDALDMWENLVESYTECSLSKPWDKLIAFSGIARLMQFILKDDYVAGLWKEHLVRGLLWHIKKAPGGVTKPYKHVIKYRAPSWSWASIDGRVDLFLSRFIENPLIIGLHSETTPLTEDIFGQLSGGFIEARGKLFAAGDLDELWDELYNSNSIDSRFLGLDNDVDCGETFFLPIAKLSNVPGYGDSLFYCLLLTHAGEHRAVHLYRRIGFALLSEDGDIAESEFLCPGWSKPPWPQGGMETLKLI